MFIKRICLINLFLLVVFMNACGLAGRAQRRADLQMLKPGMTFQQVKDLMGTTFIGYDEKHDGFVCQNYPIDYQVSSGKYTWITLLFDNERLTSFQNFTGNRKQTYGCSTLVKNEKKRREQEQLEARKKLPSAKHVYVISVMDFRGKPISGAEILFEGFDKGNQVTSGSLLTSEKGDAKIPISTTPFPMYSTRLNIKVSKDEFLGESDVFTIDLDGAGEKSFSISKCSGGTVSNFR